MLNSRTLSLLVCFSLFSRRLFKFRVGIDLDLFAYPLYIILFILIIYYGKLTTKFTISLLVFIGISSIFYVVSGYPFFNYVKTVIPMILIYTTLYSYLSNIKIDAFFRDYITISYWVAIFGIVQVVVKATTGIGLFSGYPQLDLHSIVTEPSHYVVVILPALVYTFFYYKEYRLIFWVFLLTLFLTFKLTAFAALFIIFVLIRFKPLYLLILIPIGYYGFNYLMTIPDYAFRLTPIIALFTGEELPKILSGTPLSFISNLLAAIESAQTNLFFGGGIGSHPYAYDRYFATHSWPGVDYQFGMNKMSGHAISIRLLSEYGFIGFGLIISFFVWAYRKVRNYRPYKVLYLACVAHFVAKSIKLGAYIDYGTPVFFAIILIVATRMRYVRYAQRNNLSVEEVAKL
jgi:hypothetical protein